MRMFRPTTMTDSMTSWVVGLADPLIECQSAPLTASGSTTRASTATA